MDNRIAELREERGWSQMRLAEELGTTQATVSRLENGQGLTGEWMRRLATVFDVHPIDLLTTAVAAEVQDDVELYQPEAEETVVIAMHKRGLYTYKVKRAVVDEAGVKSGSVIVVDTQPTAVAAVKSGDVVIARVRTRSGESSGLVLRRFLAPNLLTTHRTKGRDVSMKLSDPEFEIDIVGVMDPSQ